MNPDLTGAEILIAEDERVVRRSLVAMLEAEGCVVRAAADGRQAFEMYQERRPDLVILDVMMPKADGFSVCESIRRNDSVTPVVFLRRLIPKGTSCAGWTEAATSIFQRACRLKFFMLVWQLRSAATAATVRMRISTSAAGASIAPGCGCRTGAAALR
jgi:CheY-like chemotaxis protein